MKTSKNVCLIIDKRKSKFAFPLNYRGINNVKVG